MAGGGGKGRRDVEEKRSQIMEHIFGEKFDEEVEDDDDDKVSVANSGDRGRSGGTQQQNRLFPLPAAAEDEYEPGNDHGGDQWEEGQGESQGSSGMVPEIEGSPMKDEGHFEKEIQPEDIVDDDTHYEPNENIEHELKEKPLGPQLNLVVPSMVPPGQPGRMNVIKVSNIMGINPKPFDPETYVEENALMTDEPGGRKRIRLEDNVVRWRIAKNADGTGSYESNARFVKWKDGSIQLLIGNEVLDTSVNESNHDNSHLFLRNRKGLMQSQGRLLQTMRFMPSSLSSRSHRLLTALVDSQNKKTIKVQTWFDENDPERVKEEKERAEEENIRAHSILQRKKEQVKRKYSQSLKKRQKFTPGFLEDADEDEAPDIGSDQRHGSACARFEDDLEAGTRCKRRIIKKANIGKCVPCKKPFPPAGVPRHQVNEYSGSKRDESEHDTDGKDIDNSPRNGREDEDEDDPEEVIGDTSMSDENIEKQEHNRERKDLDSDEESPPPSKQHLNRRKAVVFDSDDE